MSISRAIKPKNIEGCPSLLVKGLEGKSTPSKCKALLKKKKKKKKKNTEPLN